ncbi:MAG: hypothetical protein ACFCVC_10535 [Acidimicrobiia bacterium]
MAVFFGEMQAKSDPKRMKAVVTVERGNLRLVSGTTELGEWPMHTVRLEEYTDRSVLMAVEDEELILFMDEHARFVGELGRHLKKPGEGRREPIHPAFRKEPVEQGPTIREELKDDVAREMAPIAAEARHLLDQIPRGKALYIGLAFFVVLLFVWPTPLAFLTLFGGAGALLVGGLAYADDKIAVRLPGPFTPAQLVAVGGLLLAIGIVILAVV